MQSKEILNSIVCSDGQLELEHLIDRILPRKDSVYSLDEIENRVRVFRDDIEELQGVNNDQFDVTLNKKTIEQLQNLYRSLHNTQLDVMKVQCDIAFTKEQYDTVQSICDNSLIQDRREMLIKEANLRRSLQQLKFEPIKFFFEKFVSHLGDTVAACQRLCSRQASSYLQLFDWTQYHQTIFLLRACGKAILDVNKFERLYQSNLDIVGMAFKQPIEQMDFNNFIEFQDTYSLESQLEISGRSNRRQDLKELISDPSLQSILESKEPLNYDVFESVYTRLKSITVDCCKLLVELNMNYIEAHLTDGINIDKLNGGENAAHLSPPEEQTLPLYAFSPQEYITQIGQHLLTLRKQTEQFDNIDNESLKFGLESLQEAQNIPIEVKSFKSVTEIMMRCIARHCIRSLLGRTNNSILSKLTSNGKRQLATDALYLDNVLEDLGLLNPSEPNVEKFKSLLIQ